jgi:hypothetical protein
LHVLLVSFPHDNGRWYREGGEKGPVVRHLRCRDYLKKRGEAGKRER